MLHCIDRIFTFKLRPRLTPERSKVYSSCKHRNIAAFVDQTITAGVDIGAEISPRIFDLFGIVLAPMMLFYIYAVGTFIKAGIQARKRIKLPVPAKGVLEGSNLLPTTSKNSTC